MPRKNRCYEQMTKVHIGRYRVRVWTTTLNFICTPDLRILTLANELDHRNPAPYIISQELDKLPNIAAYEILDTEGHGIVVYPDWDNEIVNFKRT